MEITYRTKDAAASMGIQVNYKPDETPNLEALSAPVLKKYDKTFKKKSLYYYDND